MSVKLFFCFVFSDKSAGRLLSDCKNGCGTRAEDAVDELYIGFSQILGHISLDCSGKAAAVDTAHTFAIEEILT